MGRDKATLLVDGEMMAVRAARALRAAGAVEVAAIGGEEAALSAAGLVVVPDGEPGGGPVQAVLTALGTGSSPLVLVVSCDLVDPSPEAMAATVAALAAGSGTADVAVPVDGSGRRQWTHAAWRRASATDAFEAAVATGERALWRAVAALRVTDVVGLEAPALTDADRPSDLERRGRRATGGSVPS